MPAPTASHTASPTYPSPTPYISDNAVAYTIPLDTVTDVTDISAHPHVLIPTLANVTTTTTTQWLNDANGTDASAADDTNAVSVDTVADVTNSDSDDIANTIADVAYAISHDAVTDVPDALPDDAVANVTDAISDHAVAGVTDPLIHDQANN
jgi:hypothetical protein